MFLDLFNITDMLLHNYVQHEKYYLKVTKNYELYYSLKMVNQDRNMSEFFKNLFLTKVIVFKVLRC